MKKLTLSLLLAASILALNACRKKAVRPVEPVQEVVAVVDADELAGYAEDTNQRVKELVVESN